jgi:hypothetical protein
MQVPGLPAAREDACPQRTCKVLEWDTRAMQVANEEEANQFIRPEYRKGWALWVEFMIESREGRMASPSIRKEDL